MIDDRYIRKARLVRVVDGDTLVVDIDLGFGIWRKAQKLRVLGVNCPETRGATKAAGLAATKFTRDWFATDLDIRVRTELDSRDEDSFGRVLAEVWQGERSLGADLLAAGHATAFMIPTK